MHIQAPIKGGIRLASLSMSMTPEEAAEAGAELKNARLERGESQREVAAATGVDQTTVGRLERGEVSQPVKLRILQRYFQVGQYKVAVPPPETLELMLTALKPHQLTSGLNTTLLNTLALPDLTDQQLVTLLKGTVEVITERFNDGKRRRRRPARKTAREVAPGLAVTGWITGEPPEWAGAVDGQQFHA